MFKQLEKLLLKLLGNHGPFSVTHSRPQHSCGTCITEARWGLYDMKSYTLVRSRRPKLDWRLEPRPFDVHHQVGPRPIPDLDPHEPPTRWMVRCPKGHNTPVNRDEISDLAKAGVWLRERRRAWAGLWIDIEAATRRD